MARGDGWDDGEALNARAADEQLATVPPRPPLQIVALYVCGAGVKPCGKPARLYPCGWRCDDEHKPGRVADATA